MEFYDYDVSQRRGTFEDNNISNCNNMYNKLLTVIENMFCNLSMHRKVINFATNMSSCII